MNDYKVIPAGSKKFTLTRDDMPIGELNYIKWSSSKADIILPNGPTYKVAPKGFWQRSTEILENGVPILTFRSHWKLGILISTPAEMISHTYRLKHKSVWKSSYELLDEGDQQILLIEQNFKWKGFKTEYLVTPSITFNMSARKELLILVSICAIKQQQQQTAAVVAST
ncbi:MAG: hypothetical protein ABWZ25_11665 [Chitinophagaceae bacterium]